jgi:hypothetical protein
MQPSSPTNGAFAPIPAGEWLPRLRFLAHAAGYRTTVYATAPAAMSSAGAPLTLSPDSMAPLHGSGNMHIGASFPAQSPAAAAAQQV